MFDLPTYLNSLLNKLVAKNQRYLRMSVKSALIQCVPGNEEATT